MSSLEGNISEKQSLVGEVSNGVVYTGEITSELDPTVPQHVKEITTEDIENWNNKSDFSGNYNDLTNKPSIPSAPTKVSQLENDKGYISSIPSEYVTETELTQKGYATENFVTNKVAEAQLSGGEVDLSGLATKDYVDEEITNVSTSVEATIKGLLGNNPIPIIELGYINANTGEVSNATTSATFSLRARTKTKTSVKGNFLIVIPEGFCARVMRYSPSYQGYDDWASGIIHLKPEEEITIHLTFAHIDTTQAITDEDIAFIQENLLIGNSNMAGGQSSNSDISLYEDCASDLGFELGTILSSNGSNSDATTRIRTINYLPAKNFTCSVDNGYKFVLYYYDASQVLIQKTTWINIPTYVDIATIPNCEYIRLLVAKNTDGVITDEEFDTVKNTLHLVYGTVDTTLTKKGIPADASVVGEKITSLEKNIGTTTNKKSVKILGIGNSYTRDSFRWLWKILKECGYDDVIVAHGYWGSSTLEQQYASLNETDENYTTYTYWKYTTNQNATKTSGANLPSIITDEVWDFVLFQQQSDWAGQYESFVSDTFDINDFISYVKTAIGNDNLKIGIASTWSHANGYDSEKFQTMYGGNPETQYQAINETIPQVANHMSQCDFVIHTGKAVELGRKNQFLGALGDEMLRPDKNHLAFGIPSFMAGMVYAITLCGVKPCDLSWYPTTSDDAEIVTDTSAYLAYLAKQCALVATTTQEDLCAFESEDNKESLNGEAIEYNVRSVNHRGYSATAPENTLPAYIMSKEKGFTYAECDVSFTSDGVAVLLHDGSINRTSNGTGNISELTYKQVSQYDFGSWKSEEYAGTKIPTFEEFIILCSRICLHPYIELKQNGSYTEQQIKGLVEVVKKYGMKNKVTWISFSATYLSYIKQTDPNARLGYLSSIDVNSNLISTVKTLRTSENEVYLGINRYDLSSEGISLCIAENIPLEVWTVNNEADILNLHPYITGITSDSILAGKLLYDSAMTGKQYQPPVTPEQPSTPEDTAIVDLALNEYNENGSITNKGTLGEDYNATVALVDGSATVVDNGLKLTNSAYFTVPTNQITANTSWSFVLGIEGIVKRDVQYCRVFRGSSDIPTIYLNSTYGLYQTKLTRYAIASDNVSYYNPNIMQKAGTTNYLGFTMEANTKYELVYTCDGSTVSFYINGVLAVTSVASAMTSPPTDIGCGDTSGTAGAYHEELTITKFKVYNKCLTAQEIAEEDI